MRSLIANEQRTEIFASAVRQRITADNELLGPSDLEFDPGAAEPTALVDRISSFGDQPLEPELLSDPGQLMLGAAKLVRKPDILRSFFNQLG
jgi:hypothetical protein